MRGQRIDRGGGDILDERYLVRRLIAETGLGTVHEALHRYTQRVVAIKRVRSSLANNPRIRERLLREARFLGAARHPGIVAVLDAGETSDGAPYMVMEFLDGRPLDGLLATRGRLTVEQTLYVGLSVCDALSYAHARGVVHRDVKPSNLFLPPEGTEGPIKLIDFGIASEVGVAETPKLTRAGEILGTAEYMAPEQLLAETSDLRCDIYALGITLFECLTGEVPFAGNYSEILAKVAKSTAPPSLGKLEAEVPAPLRAAIARAIAKNAGDRFPDALSFARALGRPMSEKPAASDAAQKRRRFPRAPYMTPVRVLRGDETALDGRSEDISEGGMLIVGPHQLENDAAVRVRFASPVSHAIVTVTATARWVRSARGGKGAIGVEFIELEESLRTSIARYVQILAPPSDAGKHDKV